MFGFGKKKQQKSKQEARNKLLLYLTSSGWQARLVDRWGAEVIWEVQSKGFQGGLDKRGMERHKALLQQALKSCRKQKQWKIVDEIHLLVEGVGMAYRVEGDPSIRGTSSKLLQQAGRTLLNVEEVTYANVGSIYSFSDVTPLRQLLTAFDKDATRVVRVISLPMLMLHAAADSSASVSLFFGAEQSQLILINRKSNSVVVRTVSVGLLSIAQAIAEKMSVSMEEALDTLKKRDHISSLTADAGGEDDSLIVQSLGPLLTHLEKELQSSIHFFVQELQSGAVSRLQWFGAVDQVNGFEPWLQQLFARSVGKDAQVVGGRSTEVLDLLYESSGDAGENNLLHGSVDSLITIGRVGYTFHEGNFLTTKEVEQLRSEKNAKLEMARKERSGASSRRGGKGSSRKQKRGKGKRGEGAQSDERQYFMLLILFFVGVVYLGYSKLEELQLQHGRVASSYFGKSSQLEQIGREIKELGGTQTRVQKKQEVDKVLWTEKFLSIADNMSENLWLSDVYLEGVEREVGNAKVSMRKLVMEGGVLPSTEGHIARIAEYVDLLLKDEQSFMSDFRDLHFTGAYLDDGGSDHVVQFTLEAIYDKNKRLEFIQEKESANPVADMSNRVNSRNDKLENIRAGKVN